MPIPPLRGRFVWHELMTTDTKSAAGFYTKVAGWKTKPFDQNPGYTMFTFKGRPMAGLMALPEPDSPLMWLAYIGTPNVDETARQAEGLGGKVVKRPEDIPTIGRFAIIQDPQGALFVAFTPLQGSNPPPDATPTLGDFSWHELVTTDWRGALAFYKSLFAWEETDSMDMGPEMGTYQMYGWKGHMLGGMMNKPRQSPAPPAWLSYIHVADSKKAAATITKLGGQLLNGPMEVPGGSWIAAGLDLQGAAFAVHSAKPAPKKSKPAKAKPARRAAAPKAVKKAAKKTAVKKKTPVRKRKAAAKRKKRAGSKK
jgi:predicted enzyme related to lactoylglutathione lyase